MSPEVRAEFEALKQRIADLEALNTNQGLRQYVDKDVQFLGDIYAAKVFTKRSGSYVELTT